MDIREGLTFDDVLLVPKFSDISSRSQTDLSTQLSRNISLNIPLISANMDTVTEASMAVAISREGGIGIVHRFLTIQEEVNEVLKVKRSGSIIIENPSDRLSGSLAAEIVSVLNGANIIRTHNVSKSKEASTIAQELS